MLRTAGKVSDDGIVRLHVLCHLGVDRYAIVVEGGEVGEGGVGEGGLDGLQELSAGDVCGAVEEEAVEWGGADVHRERQSGLSHSKRGRGRTSRE